MEDVEKYDHRLKIACTENFDFRSGPQTLYINISDHEDLAFNTRWSSIVITRNDEEIKFSNEEIFNLLKRLKGE